MSDAENQKPKENAPELSPEEKKRQDWVKMMRLKFSPAEMLSADGNLCLEYSY